MEREPGLVQRPSADLPVPQPPVPPLPVPQLPVPRQQCGSRPGRTPGASRLRVAAWLVGATLLVAAALFGLVAQGRLHHTDQVEATARASLHHSRLVAAAEHGSWAEVSSAAARRGRTLAAAQGQLSALRFQLSEAQASAFFGGINIADLDQCLAGVEQSLNELSLSDPEGAVASLTAVSPQCNATEAST